MQWQDQVVSLADRGVDEQTEALGGGSAVAFGGTGVGENLLEGMLGQVAEQVVAGWEVPVEGADADTGVRCDCRHGDVQSFSMDRRGRGADQLLLVA